MTHTLPADVAARVHYIMHADPVTAVRLPRFRGLTPAEYRDAVVTYVRARVAAGDVGSIDIDPAGFPAKIREKIRAADARHVARQLARHAPAHPSLRERLAAYRAAYRYGISLPRLNRVWGRSRHLDKVRRQIELAHAPGYTTEPYVQLCAQSPLDRRRDHWRVVAEWHQDRWLSPLAAAGLVSRRV